MKKMKKLTVDEAQKLKEEFEKQAPGKKFVFNPDVVEMPPLKLEIESVLDSAIKRLSDVLNRNEDITDAELAKTIIIFPVREAGNTKKNRARLADDDRTSPLGVIIKDDLYAMERYKPYAPASFNAREVVKWASEKLARMEQEKSEAAGV